MNWILLGVKNNEDIKFKNIYKKRKVLKSNLNL